MNLLASIVAYVCLALLAGLGVLKVLGRFMEWMLARLKRREAAAIERLRIARVNLHATLQNLNATTKLIETYHFRIAPMGSPPTDYVCCKKVEPCPRHTPQ